MEELDVMSLVMVYRIHLSVRVERVMAVAETVETEEVELKYQMAIQELIMDVAEVEVEVEVAMVSVEEKAETENVEESSFMKVAYLILDE